MAIKLHLLASLPLLLLAGCGENDLNVGTIDAGPDSPGTGGVNVTGGAGGGSGGAGGGQTGGGQSTTCDPLAPAPKPIGWASIIAGGRSATGTVYAVDQTADSVQRVFVSDAGGTMVRQRIAGSGSGTSPSGTGFYVFSVTDTSAPFVLQIDASSTAALRMGVVQGTLTDRKTFVIGQDGEELTVLPNATIAAMPVRNLPGTIVAEYVATLPDGRVMLVTRPLDDWSYQDFRLFLGPPSVVAERQVASVTRAEDGGTTTILFDLDGVQATAYFPVLVADASFVAGPATLTVGGVVTPLTRATTPPSNAVYLCFGGSAVDAGRDGPGKDDTGLPRVEVASEPTDGGPACVALASVSDQCPADWGTAVADQSAFCAAYASPYDAFLSIASCRGSLHYTRYLFDAGPRVCLYDPTTGALVGYRAVDAKAGFEQTSCGSNQADFDDQGCAGTRCAKVDASASASD